MRYFLTILMMTLVSTSAVSAQSDTSSFPIRVFGAEDIVAPTTPTLISATPISTDQIDTVWSVSTDNFVVSGYVLSRDGVPLGTTTLTNYSDTGLAASTTYLYSVRAFDTFFNYSSSSNILSATTLAPPPPPDAAGGKTQGTVARIVLNELRVTAGVSTSTFYIKTARPARFEMRWGRTNSYELGYVVNDRFVSEYETTITDLEPGTTYEYEVIGYTPYGKASVLERGQFSTLGPADFLPPANINRFVAVRSGTNVDLSWLLPAGQDFDFVRIVRSHLGFPNHLQDGAVVYQGRGESVTDKDILNQYSPVYYTAFVVDAAGNVSSGAVAKAFYPKVGDNTPGAGAIPGSPGLEDGDGVPVVSEGQGSASTSPKLSPGTRMPDLSEIFLLQNGERRSFSDMELVIDSTKPFVLFIPKEAVSENLKTLLFTLTDPTDSRQASSFMLRLNKDKTAYEAVIAPLNLEGNSRFVVDIYDYESAVVGTFQKTVRFETGKSAVISELTNEFLLIPLAVFLSLMGIFIFLFYRRRHQRP